MADEKTDIEIASAPPAPTPEERVESWKEIAAYLQRDVRTVQRWEKKEGLPVHRHMHDKLGTVYSYKAELDAWWNNRRPLLERQDDVSLIRRLPWPVTAPLALCLVAMLVLAVYFGWRLFRPEAKPPAGKIMLAVLPFENLSADSQEEYFSDGLTEEMITQLGRMQPQRLGVIARTSAMHYKGTDKSIAEIGRELGVNYIVEGSVLRAGKRVRINAQLVQVSDQAHLWANSYERDAQDVLRLQNEVVQAIAAEIRVALPPADQARLESAGPVNAEAYEAYLKGRYFQNQRDEEGLAQALVYFQRAIEIDPNYSLAYTGLADSYIGIGARGILPPKEAYSKAKVATLKALELDDTLAEAHASLGYIDSDYDWDWPGAESELLRAIAINPNYAQAHRLYARYLQRMAKHEEALAAARRAQELDPVSAVNSQVVGYSLSFAGQQDQAIGEFRRALDFNPSFASSHCGLGRAYERKAMLEQAIAEYQACGSKQWLAHGYAAAGRRSEARRLLAELKAGAGRQYTPAYGIAIVHADLGENDQALEWLERAYEQREPALTFVRLAESFYPLRSDPRFQDLVRRMNFPN